MGIDVAGTLITGGTSIAASDSSGNKLYQQSSGGVISGPVASGGNALTPLFCVGFASPEAWVDFGSNGTWYKGAFAYTGGNGYYNVGSCYNTSTYRFTAPWTGMYLFRQLMALYYNNSSYGLYTHPVLGVNGSVAGRRNNTPYRIRAYGSYASYGSDTDGCELLYLTAGDYVEAYYYVGTNMSGYGPYGSFSGTYLGS